MMRWFFVAIGLMLFACSGDGEPRAISSPVGPDRVEIPAIEEHADQFDDDLPRRPAGSQQELAAASYITGHLQQAGYLVELDAVPVEDLVRSSNVVALPPSGDDPEIVVVVGYDTIPDQDAAGAAIGTFLEVARALRASVPDHSVEFVAVGAENAEANGGALGSRRLVRIFQEADVEPEIVQIIGIGGTETMAIDGPAESAFCDISLEGEPRNTACVGTGLLIEPDPFLAAGFDRTVVVAPGPEFGNVLLEYLKRRSL